jgi:protein O-mannosyl-transferase
MAKANKRVGATAARPQNGGQDVAKQPSGAAIKSAVAGGTPSFLSSKVALLILGIFSFVLYANTLGHGYVLDDVMVKPENRYVQKGLEGLKEIFSTTYMSGYVKMPYDNYRPLSLATFAVEQQLFGPDAGKSHLGNVLLFAAGVCALFVFLKKLLPEKQTYLAFAACLLFAAHPVHTEVVANVKGRDELLCFLMGMVALACYTYYLSTGKIALLAAAGVAYFLSLLSKETTITLPAVLLLTALIKGSDKRKLAAILGVSVAVAGLFLAIRHQVQVANGATESSYLVFIDNQLAEVKSVATRYATATLAMGHYLRLLLVGYPLSCSYAFNTIPNTTFGNPLVLLSGITYLALIAFAIRRLLKNRTDVLAFALLFMVINLALFSNYFLMIASLMAERFLFFASVGFCLALVLGADLLLNKKSTQDAAPWYANKLWYLVLPLMIAHSAITYARNADWADNVTLFSADVKKSPNDARLNYYLGNEMTTVYAQAAPPTMQGNIMTEGIAYLRKAVEIYPTYSQAQTSLGSAYFKMQQFDSAEVAFLRTLKYDSVSVLALNGLAGVYFMKNDLERAKAVLIRDVAINPNSTDIVHNLGLCYLNLRKFDSAVYYGHKVLSINPKHIETLKDMTRAFAMLNNADSMQHYLALVQRLEPTFKLQ